MMQHCLKFLYSLVLLVLLGTSCQKEVPSISDQPTSIALTSGGCWGRPSKVPSRDQGRTGKSRMSEDRKDNTSNRSVSQSRSLSFESIGGSVYSHKTISRQDVLQGKPPPPGFMYGYNPNDIKTKVYYTHNDRSRYYTYGRHGERVRYEGAIVYYKDDPDSCQPKKTNRSQRP